MLERNSLLTESARWACEFVKLFLFLLNNSTESFSRSKSALNFIFAQDECTRRVSRDSQFLALHNEQVLMINRARMVKPSRWPIFRSELDFHADSVSLQRSAFGCRLSPDDILQRSDDRDSRAWSGEAIAELRTHRDLVSIQDFHFEVVSASRGRQTPAVY